MHAFQGRRGRSSIFTTVVGRPVTARQTNYQRRKAGVVSVSLRSTAAEFASAANHR